MVVTPRRILLSLIAAFALALSAALPASACSCALIPTVELAKRADVVARVTVTEVPPLDGWSSDAAVLYLMTPTHVWKGKVPAQALRVSSAASGASCGLEFIEVGQDLILFAEGTAPDQLRAGLCGGTAPAAERLADVVKALGAGTPMVVTPPTPTPEPEPTFVETYAPETMPSDTEMFPGPFEMPRQGNDGTSTGFFVLFSLVVVGGLAVSFAQKNSSAGSGSGRGRTPWRPGPVPGSLPGQSAAAGLGAAGGIAAGAALDPSLHGGWKQYPHSPEAFDPGVPAGNGGPQVVADPDPTSAHDPLDASTDTAGDAGSSDAASWS